MTGNAGRLSLFVAWGLAALLYAWWASPRLAAPPLADEAFFSMQALEHGHDLDTTLSTIPHPPLYMELLRAGVRLFGWGSAEFRAMGMAAFLMTMALVGWLAQRCVPGAGPWAMLLWAIHPMAVQGSLILDIDNTVLATAMAAFMLACVWAPWPLSARRRWLLTALWFLGLWMKLSGVLVLGVPLALAWWLSGRRRSDLLSCIMIAGTGTAAFAVSWWWYTHQAGADPAIILRHTGGSLRYAWHITPLSGLQEVGLRLARVGFWWLPWAWVLAAAALWRTLRLPQGPLRWRMGVLGISSLLIGAAYLVVRGTHYTFPKYHYPLLAFAIVWWSALAVHAQPVWTARARMTAAAVVGLMAAATWHLGDALYTINAALRQATIEQPEHVGNILHGLAVRLLAWALAGAVLWVVWRAAGRQRGVLVPSLLLLAGASLAHDVWQRQASYATTFCYGRSYDDFREVTRRVDALRKAHPESEVFLPVDISHALGYTEAEWNRMSPLSSDMRRFAAQLPQRLSERSLGVLVWSWTYNSASQVALFNRPDIQDLLRRSFRQERIGEYTLWHR